MRKWEAHVKRKAILLVGVALVAMAATPAEAVSFPQYPGRVKNADFSAGAFQSKGDYVGALDFAADGKSAVTRWKTDYGRSGRCWDTNGAQNGFTACNYNMKENRFIKFQVCHANYGSSSYSKCSEWSPWVSIRNGVEKG
ncbi:hypothetical protein ABZ569_22280 [Streptomyces albus]|uniref:hypothetical protein n=1 Tax=Streptomyces albus TaxID=1888 RepID=UPI0033C92DD4